jgi:hypothetical protein
MSLIQIYCYRRPHFAFAYRSSFKLFLLYTLISFNFVYSLKFTSNSFTGYISENVASSSTASFTNPLLTPHHTNNTRHNRNLVVSHSQTVISINTNNQQPIYVRFVDKFKPSFTFVTTTTTTTCRHTLKNTINLKLTTNDEYNDTEALNLFKILHDDIECFPFRNQQNECICYFRVRLIESDEAHERRLNREAKESYHMRVIISSSDNDDDNDNAAFAYIRVNVLDDNDLEPMFDQSEFVFELNEDSHYLPAFTYIGRVTATDPDLDLNSHVRYFINCNEHNSCNKFFGIQWRTGDVYLKQSSHELFAFSINEFNFEINAIDAGLKTNLVKTLLSLTNQTLLANDAEAEASSWEDKLLKLTATHPNISKALPSSSSSSFRVETAQVKIKLNTLSKTNIDLIKFNDTASHDLLEQVFFRLTADPSRMPLAILQTNSSSFPSPSQQLIRHHHLRLLKLYTRNSLTQNYLIYSSDTTLSNVDIDLSFLLLSLTSKPKVSILDDVISRLCTIEMSVIESSTQLVFRVDSILGTILGGGDGENFCQNLLIYQYYNLFHYEYQLENDDDGHHNLSSSSIAHNLITIRPSNSFKSLRLRASLIFNKTRVVLSTSKVFKFDSIKTNLNLMSGKFRLPTRKHLTLKWSSTRQKLDDTILNNASMIIASEPRGVFNLDNGYLMSQVANNYVSTNLLIRVNSSLDYLSVHVRANQEFEEKNCFINVKLTNSVNQTSRQFKVGVFLFFFQVTKKYFYKIENLEKKIQFF